MKHKGLLLVALPVVAIGLMLLVASLSRPPARAQIATPLKARQATPGMPAEDVGLLPAPEPAKALEKEAEMAQVARAMDLSNVRVLARTLSEAAALQDVGRVSSMKSALRRYGALARPILQEELAEQTNPRALAALTEAMSDAR